MGSDDWISTSWLCLVTANISIAPVRYLASVEWHPELLKKQYTTAVERNMGTPWSKRGTTKTVLTPRDPCHGMAWLPWSARHGNPPPPFSPPILKTMGPGTGGVSPVSTKSPCVISEPKQATLGRNMNVREWGGGGLTA